MYKIPVGNLKVPLLSSSVPELKMDALASFAEKAIFGGWPVNLRTFVRNKSLNNRGMITKDIFLSTHQPLFPEIDAHRGDEFVVENIVGILKEEAGFSNAGVAQSQELQQIVVVHCWRSL